MDNNNQLDTSDANINNDSDPTKRKQVHLQEGQENIGGNDEESSEELNIARRTRSHVRMDDFVPDDNLDFPDVDKSLYQNPDSVTDPEYKNFLYQCYSNPVDLCADTTSEDNDPPYIQNDDIFSHGWKFDLDEELLQHQQLQRDEEDNVEGPGGTDKDLHEASERLTELIGVPAKSSSRELFPAGVEERASCVVVDANYDPSNTDLISSFSDHKSAVASLSSVPGFKSPHKTGFTRRRIDYFDDPEFKRVLDQQLRQHVQLLTQTYLLASCMTNMQDQAAEARSHLNSYMKIFRNRRKPSNLLPAMKIIAENVSPRELKSSVRLSWRQLPVPDTARRIIDSQPNVFPYLELLPQVAFSVLPDKLVTKKPKIIFTPNEDKLLALALKEFENEYSQYAYIASLLMAAKTKMQINNHVKNIKRSAGNEDNPIRLFLAHGQLPQVDLDSDSRLRDLSSEKIVISCDIETVRPVISAKDQTEEPEHRLEDNNGTDEKQHFAHLRQHVSGTEGGEKKMRVEPSEKQEKEDHNDDRNDEGEKTSNNPAHDPNTMQFHNCESEIMNMDLDDLMAASTTISKNNPHNGGGHTSTSISEKNMKLRKSMVNLLSHKFSLTPEMGHLLVQDFLKTSQEKLDEQDHMNLLKLITTLMMKNTQDDNKMSGVKAYNEILSFLDQVKAPKELTECLVLFLDLDEATKCDCASEYLHWMQFLKFFQHLELYHDSEVLEKKLIRLIDALQKDDPHKIRLAVASLINKHPLLKAEYEALSLDSKPHPSLFANEDDFDDITELFAQHDNDPDKDRIDQFEHFNLNLSQDDLNYASQSCPCTCHRREDGAQQHCNQCNLKFMRGRPYLVNKIKPFLAEWNYIESDAKMAVEPGPTEIQWTFEEDKEILEFCRTKAERNDENVTFDSTTFEELVKKRRLAGDTSRKKGAKEIAERFNYLMEMYRRDDSAAAALGV